MNRTIQKLEQQMQERIHPALDQPEILEDDSDTTRSITDALHTGIRILRLIHQKTDNQVTRRPTLKARMLIWFGIPSPDLSHHTKSGEDSLNRDIIWLKNQFSEWNNLLAGLQLGAEDQLDQTVDFKDPQLGYLRGKDWLRVLNAYLS